MIVKQSRIKTGGSGGIIEHVLNERDNEAVAVLRDDFEDLQAMEAVGASADRKYGIRHFIVSPDQELTPDQLDQVMAELAEEFGFGNRSVSVVEHSKNRADGGDAPHFHILVSELDDQNRVMDSSKMFARNEKVARKLEVMFGHDVQKGRHNRAVEQALRDEGHNIIADRLAPLTEGPPPNSAFSSKQHARAKRLGIDLPRIAAEIQFISDLPTTEKAQKLRAIGEKYNVQFQQGDKKSVLTIKTKTGDLIGNANKAAGIRGTKEVSALAAAIAAAGETAERLPSFAEGLRRFEERGIQGSDAEPTGSRLSDDEPDHAPGRERGASGSGSGNGADDDHRHEPGGADRGAERHEPAPSEDRGAATRPTRSGRDTSALNMLTKAAVTHGGAALAAIGGDEGTVSEVLDPRDPNSYYRVMWAIDAQMKRRNRQQNSSYGGYAGAGSTLPSIKQWLDDHEDFRDPATDLKYLRAFAINRRKADLPIIDEIAEIYRQDQTADFDVIEEYDQPSQLRM